MTEDQIKKNFSLVARKMVALFKDTGLCERKIKFVWNQRLYSAEFLIVESDGTVVVKVYEEREFSRKCVFEICYSASGRCYWEGGRIEGFRSFEYVESEVPINVYLGDMEAVLANWKIVKDDLTSAAAERKIALDSFEL